MKIKKSLYSWLVEYGWNIDIASEAEVAYKKSGIEAAVATLKWADDEEHLYSEELEECIVEWINTKQK